MVKHRHADASVCVKPYNLCDKGLTETEYSDSGITAYIFNIVRHLQYRKLTYSISATHQQTAVHRINDREEQ